MISALLGWPTRVPNDDSRLQHSCKASWQATPADGSSAWPSLHMTHVMTLLGAHLSQSCSDMRWPS